MLYYQIDKELNWYSTSSAIEYVESYKEKRFSVLPQEFINTKVLNLLNSLGINIEGLKAYFFVVPPKYTGLIHIDSVEENHALWALNWAWGSSSHAVEWFNVTGNTRDELTGFGENLPYKSYVESNRELIDSVMIKETKPTLLKPGIPHRITNFSNSIRWSVSIRDINFSINTKYPWSLLQQKLEENNNECNFIHH